MNSLLRLKFIIFLFLVCCLCQLFAQTPAVEVTTYNQLVHAIRETRAASEKRIEEAVDAEKVREAWEIGSLIQKHILNNDTRAEYGEKIVKKLAKDLDLSKTELSYMLEFARAYPIVPPAGQLSWSHYQALLAVNDAHEREALAAKAEKENWGRDRVREEVKKRSNRSEAKVEKLEAKPGKLYTYRITEGGRGEGVGNSKLKIDLGFSAYLELPEKYGDKFKASDIVQYEKNDPKFNLKLFPSPNPSSLDPLYTYKAQVIEIVDGDTLHVSVDLGFGFTMNQTLRLRGLDAPETESSDGKQAKEFLRNLLGQAQFITIKTSKSDKYDRYLADVWAGEKYINQELLNQNLAVQVND